MDGATISDSGAEHEGPPRLFWLKLVALLMGLVLAMGFGFVVATIVYRAQALVEPGPPPATVDWRVDRPAGSELISAQQDGRSLRLHFRAADGTDTVLLVDLDDPKGQPWARLTIPPVD